MKNKFLVSLFLSSALILTGCGESHTYPPKDFNTLSLIKKVEVSKAFIAKVKQEKDLSDIQKEDLKLAKANFNKYNTQYMMTLVNGISE